jgi:hypothetical protein
VQIRRVAAFALAISAAGFAAESPRLYGDARALWNQNKDREEYQAYAAEFSQFNNHFHLDEKDGCYRLAPGPVELMLVITHSGGDKFAIIERVLSDVDNQKARCFKQTYGGIQTKIPPYLPFVLQMSMR